MPLHVPDGIVQYLGRSAVQHQRMRAWSCWLKSSHALPLDLTPEMATDQTTPSESGTRMYLPGKPHTAHVFATATTQRRSSFQRNNLPALSLVIRRAVTLLTQPFPCSRQYEIRARVLCQFRQSVPPEQLINGGCRYRPAGTFFEFGL